MYCARCGVELADTENKCPLCGTRAYHPDIERERVSPNYPHYMREKENIRPQGLLFILTMLAMMPITITLFCDIYLGGGITWSGYPVGGIILFYTVVILPMWFTRPNPVIFVPIDFGVLALYLLYINFATDGDWYLTFALPVLLFAALCTSAVVTLLRYTRRGRLYLFGAIFIAIGVYCMLIEFFLNLTVGKPPFAFFWSPYPFIACFLAGIALIIVAISRPLRESLKKRFFI